MEVGYRSAILLSIALESTTTVLLGVHLAATRSRPRRAAPDERASGAYAHTPRAPDHRGDQPPRGIPHDIHRPDAPPRDAPRLAAPRSAGTREALESLAALGIEIGHLPGEVTERHVAEGRRLAGTRCERP